jgi:hypothetical protein
MLCLVQGDSTQTSVPPSGSGRASLIAAVAAAGAGLLVMRMGSGHTADSRTFATRPEFGVWVAVLAVELAAAAALFVANWPAVRMLGEAAGRRAVIGALAAWLAVGLLLMSGPRTWSAHADLWLVGVRLAVVNVAVGILLTRSFVGLALAQTRLSALRHDIPGTVVSGSAGALIVELLWLRAALQRFLVSFAIVISGAVLAAGALRVVLLADGVPKRELPVVAVLVYGGIFTAVTALIFVPVYVAWQERVVGLRDQLHPVPENGVPPHEWYQARTQRALCPSQPRRRPHRSVRHPRPSRRQPRQ